MKKWYYNSWLLAAMYVVGGIGSLFLIGLPILITAIVFTALKTGFEKKVTSEDFKIYQDYIEKNKTLAELDNKIISWCRALFLLSKPSFNNLGLFL